MGICQYVAMPQQPTSLSFFDANATPDFAVALRGYDREQVNKHIALMQQELAQARTAREEAERHLSDAQRRLRAAEQRLAAMEQKLTDTNKQLEESTTCRAGTCGSRSSGWLRNRPTTPQRIQAGGGGHPLGGPAGGAEITDKARARRRR